MGMVKKYFSIHAHFYQPPRDDPFSGEIQEETHLAEYSNYNDLIIDECYGPLSVKAIKSKFNDFVSVYSYINFNFGPTLLNYIEENYPKLYISIIEADVLSKKIFSKPSAIAQVYNHSILPLLPLNKKRLYVKWGIESFKRHFKREPLGMWLSECACDDETLEVLIENNILFTVLSPSQAMMIKDLKTGETKKIFSYEDLDTGNYYIWRSKNFKDKYIKIFFYNKSISDKMIRELESTEKYILRIKSFFSNGKNPQFCLIASDGENYGHHIKNGDKFVMNLINKLNHDGNIEITNLSNLIDLNFSYEVEIKSPSAWSCEHGVGRWMDECGCRINCENRYQKWRKRLKNVVDEFSLKSDDMYLKNTVEYLKNPDDALSNFITVYEQNDPHKTLKFIQENSRRILSKDEISKVLKALNSQIQLSFAYTSCGWFFDDVLNIETLNNIKRLVYINEYLKENGENFVNKILDFNKEKTNYKKNVEKEINKILKIVDNEKRLAGEFALFDHIRFINPFFKTIYKFKIIAKIQPGVYIISSENTKTLEEKIFTVYIWNEKENLIIRVKEKEDNDLKLIEKSQFEKFMPFLLSDLSIETQKLIKVFKEDLKFNEVKKLLIMISNFNYSEEYITKLKRQYLNVIINYPVYDLPYIRNITRIIIKNNRSLPLDDEIFKVIKEKKLHGIMWKLEAYDNKKIYS